MYDISREALTKRTLHEELITAGAGENMLPMFCSNPACKVEDIDHRLDEPMTLDFSIV